MINNDENDNHIYGYKWLLPGYKSADGFQYEIGKTFKKEYVNGSWIYKKIKWLFFPKMERYEKEFTFHTDVEDAFKYTQGKGIHLVKVRCAKEHITNKGKSCYKCSKIEILHEIDREGPC